jgi:N-acetylneuraminic acid mutarotase
VPQTGRSAFLGTIGRVIRVLGALLALLFVAAAGGAAPAWQAHAALPAPRSEVAAAVLGAEIVVAGGYDSNGSTSARVDAYNPATDRWRRMPDLPAAANHAMAAATSGRLYVAGGYGADGLQRRTVSVFAAGRWQKLPSMPETRAAGGAAIIGARLYVAGGVTGTRGTRRLARTMLAFNLKTRRWRSLRGPTPREHLGVAALGGKLYVVAGRLAGLDTNQTTAEAFDPATARWRRLAPLPGARGGTGLAAVNRSLVSVGGEEPAGTIRSVYRFTPRTGRWQQLPDLPTARHGLGVVGLRGRVYAVAGGPSPGLAVSGANESIAVG